MIILPAVGKSVMCMHIYFELRSIYVLKTYLMVVFWSTKIVFHQDKTATGGGIVTKQTSVICKILW